MERPLFLGIDGGGTNCRARIADTEGRVLGEGRAGPSNTRLGLERAFTEIVTAATEALAVAGLKTSQLACLHAGAGLAGLTIQSDQEGVAAYAHPFASLAINNDAYAACLGAFGGEDGGILVLGTGSCGCALVDGKVVTVGGWGFEIANQGSGSAVGREAVRHAVLAHEDVIPCSDLSRRILCRFGGSPEGAVLWAAAAEPADYGRFARLVVELAKQGDPMACDLMRRAGADTSKLIQALNRRGATRIALVGGFSAPLRPWLADDIQPLLVEPQGDAMDGALIMARRAFAKEPAIQ